MNLTICSPVAYTVPMQSEAKLYELSYIFKPESEEETDAINELARKYIENGKGMVLEAYKPSRRQLAYPIQKQREAHFGSIKFYLPPGDIRGFEDLLRREKRLMRYLVALSHRPELETRRRERVRAAKLEEKPAADIASIDKKLEEILGK